MPAFYCLDAAIDIKRSIFITCDQWVNRRDLEELPGSIAKDQDSKAATATPEYSLAPEF